MNLCEKPSSVPTLQGALLPKHAKAWTPNGMVNKHSI